MSTAKLPAFVLRPAAGALTFNSAIAGEPDTVNALNSLTQLASGIWMHNGLKVHDTAGGFADRELISAGSVIEPVMEIANQDHATGASWNWVNWAHGNAELLGWGLKADGMDVTYLGSNDGAGAASLELHQHMRLLFPGTTMTIGWTRSIHRFDADQLTILMRAIFKPGYFIRTLDHAGIQAGADVDRWLVDGATPYVLQHNESTHYGPQAQRFGFASAVHPYRIMADMQGTQDYTYDASGCGCTITDHQAPNPPKGYALAISNETNMNWPAAVALNISTNFKVSKV